MSTNEDGRFGNAPAPPLPPAVNANIGEPRTQLSAWSSDFTMPDAPAGMQQDWYTHAAGRALMYAQNGTASTPDGYSSSAAAVAAESSGAYAVPPVQQAPFIRAAAAEHHDTEFPAGQVHEPAPLADDSAGRPNPDWEFRCSIPPKAAPAQSRPLG